MEVVSMVKEVLQNVAEHVASYHIGQTALWFLDKTLNVVEECARWAVPPPLDQDERPQPELVRPLPWVFFLCMLITLRVMRETISFANLIMGKPPLRSADVVIYIQSKRRYLRTLKYQGNRIMRTRTGGAQPTEPWYSSLRSLFEFTMCFRRNSLNYGNNNTTSVSNNEEVLVVKRSKRGREDTSPVTSGSVDSTMERLIEKMMVDLNADSDEESAYTLTDVTSLRSEKSELSAQSDQDTVLQNTSQSKRSVSNTPEKNNDESVSFTPSGNAICSTPEKTKNTEEKEKKPEMKKENFEPKKDDTQPKKENSELKKESLYTKKETSNSKKVNADSKKDNTEPKKVNLDSKKENPDSNKDNTEIKKDNTELNKDNNELNKNNTELNKDNTELKKYNTESKQQANEVTLEENNENSADSPTLELKQESLNFIENERSTQKVHRTPKNEKIANGRTVKSVPSKKKGSQTERREHTAIPARIPSDNKSF